MTHAKKFYFTGFCGLVVGFQSDREGNKTLSVAGDLGCGAVGLWSGPNMTHMQKSFRSCGFVGLWFGLNLTEREIKLSLYRIGWRARMWGCGLVV